MKQSVPPTAAQQLERAELALQQQDVDQARECLHDAACLTPEVRIATKPHSSAGSPAQRIGALLIMS